MNAGRAVVFVDVDGVLNYNSPSDDADLFWPNGWKEAMCDNCLSLSQTLLRRFAALVSAQDLEIVLSTSWRLDATARSVLLAAFAEVGIECAARVQEDTRDLSRTSQGLYPGGVRGDEIADWLERHGWPVWIAIDDMPLGTPEAEDHRQTPLMDGHFVNTDGSVGLSEEMAMAAAALLAQQRASRHGPGSG
jgi:hypothetical protein